MHVDDLQQPRCNKQVQWHTRRWRRSCWRSDYLLERILATPYSKSLKLLSLSKKHCTDNTTQSHQVVVIESRKMTKDSENISPSCELLQILYPHIFCVLTAKDFSFYFFCQATNSFPSFSIQLIYTFHIVKL